MSAVARLPLLPTACAVTALAALGSLSVVGAGLVACVLAAGCGALALASADRMRRIAWLAAAVCAIATFARLAIGDVPLPALEGDALHALRDRLGDPLRRLVPEPESGILLGIALGDRTSIGHDLALAFARSGTTHLLAISGFNMTLVAAAVAAILRGRTGARTRAAVTVAAVVAYSLLVGLGGSVLRSAVMASTAALGLALGRRAAAANGLCAAVGAMLVLDPRTLGDAGFLLSVSATAGLLAWQAPIAARLGRFPTAVREGLAATLAATAPTLPIVAGIFGRVSLVSPIANLVAVPLFPPLMVASVATVGAGAVSLDAAWPFALIAYGLAFALRTVVELAAAVPVAAIDVPAGPLTALAFAAAIPLVTAAARRIRPPVPFPRWIALRLGGAFRSFPGRPLTGHRVAWGHRLPLDVPWRAIAIGLAILLAIGSATVVVAAGEAPAVRVRALDVGQGDAFLLELDGHLALVDGGPEPGRLLAELGASLPPWTRRIDLVALTHAHLDHGAGLLAVLDRYDVGLAIAPRGLNAGPLADGWNERIARHGVARSDATVGTTVHLGRATIRVLSPNGDPAVDVPSLVLRVELGTLSLLLCGDVTEAAQADLLLDPASLRARVYVPPHHGAATPYAAALVGAVAPEIALISVGFENRYGHPTAETLDALASVATYRTDRDGTVAVAVDGARVAVRTHANGLAPPRPGYGRAGR